MNALFLPCPVPAVGKVKKDYANIGYIFLLNFCLSKIMWQTAVYE